MGSQVASIGKAPLVLGSSFFQQGPSYAALRCPFRPTSGGYGSGFYRQDTESNAVTVQLPGTSAQFAGKLEPCKGSVDCVAIFDGKTWRLELLTAHINTRFVRGSNNGTHASTPPPINTNDLTQSIVLEAEAQSPEEADVIAGDDLPSQPVNVPVPAMQTNGIQAAQQQQSRPNSSLGKPNKDPAQPITQARKRTREPEGLVEKPVDVKKSKPGMQLNPSSKNPVIQHNAVAATRPNTSTLQQQQHQKQHAVPSLDEDDEDLDLLAVFNQEFAEQPVQQADASHRSQNEGILATGIHHDAQDNDDEDDDDDMSSLIPMNRPQPVQQQVKQPSSTPMNGISRPAATPHSNGAAAAAANKPTTSRSTAAVQPAHVIQNRTAAAAVTANNQQRPISQQPAKAPTVNKTNHPPAAVQKPAVVQKPPGKPASAAAAWGFKGLDDDEDDDEMEEEEEEQPNVQQTHRPVAMASQHNVSRSQPAAIADDDDEYDEDDDDDAHLRCSDDEASDDLGLEDGLC